VIGQARFPASDAPFMVQAALLLREKKEKGKEAGAKADELLSAYAAQHQGEGVASRVQLMRAQIAAAAGNWRRAAAALQAVPTLAARGAVVATTGTSVSGCRPLEGQWAWGRAMRAWEAQEAGSPHHYVCAASSIARGRQWEHACNHTASHQNIGTRPPPQSSCTC
jgi:hypothetical protein